MLSTPNAILNQNAVSKLAPETLTSLLGELETALRGNLATAESLANRLSGYPALGQSAGSSPSPADPDVLTKIREAIEMARFTASHLDRSCNAVG
jgi:hypothetical protein